VNKVARLFYSTYVTSGKISGKQATCTNTIHSLKCLRSTTLGSKEIGIKKSEFVAKTQFIWWLNII